MPTAVEEAQSETIESDHATSRKPAVSRADDHSREGTAANARRQEQGHLLSAACCQYSLSRVRMRPQTSSFLRPGLEFVGTQQSGRAVYEVNVSLKFVDLEESFLCGFLKISGLSEDHPTLTTYFEGEIIGSKYSFITRNPTWNSTEQIDIEHWARFAAFKPIAPTLRNARMQHQRTNQASENALKSHDHVFMRWKELQILPNDAIPQDSSSPTPTTTTTATTTPTTTPATGANATQAYRDRRTRNLEGVSYAGFYYICLDQRNGLINGMYYHQNRQVFLL